MANSEIKIALAGNPNCGKTTLFNALTGSNQFVGNWPGVTVDKKEGIYKKSAEPIAIIDLPGIYSLSPYTPEEVIARNYNNRNIAGRFFELGTIYLPKESADILPEERGVAVIGSYGEKEDFFAMKGIILEALDKLGVYGVEFTANKENPTFHRGRCADISIGEKKIGVIGEIAPAVLDNYGMSSVAKLKISCAIALDRSNLYTCVCKALA